MTNTFPLSGQICDWLFSMGFQGRVGYSSDLPLPFIEVVKEGSVKMEILPVELAACKGLSCAYLPEVLAENISARRGKGRPVIVIWEDFWISKNNIVKSRLAAMLGISAKIPARLTQVRRIENALATGFLAENHLNGPTTSKFRYGLFLPQRYYRVLPDNFVSDHSREELLVAVATFSHARIFEQKGTPFRSHELIRFASLLNTNVVGALDKLLRAFMREKEPDDIMTYADIEWSDGRSYVKLGFEKRGAMAPREALLDTGNMLRVKEVPKVSETESIQPSVDYLTVYNLGSIKYVLTINTSSDAD